MENIKEIIKDFCREYDYDYVPDYSGRGMYGRKCIGIICDSTIEALAFLFAYIVDSVDMEEMSGEAIRDTLGTPRQDSMGLSKILYFPKLKM